MKIKEYDDILMLYFPSMEILPMPERNENSDSQEEQFETASPGQQKKNSKDYTPFLVWIKIEEDSYKLELFSKKLGDYTPYDDDDENEEENSFINAKCKYYRLFTGENLCNTHSLSHLYYQRKRSPTCWSHFVNTMLSTRKV